MNFLSITRKYVFLVLFFFSAAELWANLPTSCPVMAKRNNGNGNSGVCAALFGNPVASNVVGTPYATVLSRNNLTASNKTGNFTLVWFGQIITEAPVITRVWVGTTLTNTVVGPPSPITVNNGNSYVDYCFYRYNLPNQGTLTLEFANPKTGAPISRCCYDIQTNASCATPAAVSCAPTISTQPVNKFLCGESSTFVFITASGATSYAWEYLAPGGSWASTSSIANFVGTTNDTLTINSLNTYNGYKFRCSVTNSGSGCGSVVSSEVTVNAYPKPTASFAAGSYICGPRPLNLQINLTGTGPWNFTYKATPPGTSTTINNITTSPYYLAVNPTVTTTYEITGVNDKYCANTLTAGSVQIVVQEKPTITLTSSSISTCFGSGTASLAYTATANSPNQYSITTGTRAVSGFLAVTNATLNSSPISITLPANTPTGTYDFNLTVRNSTSGCVSAAVPFTITVNAKPDISVSSSVSSVCSGGNATLTVAPANLSSGSYAWSPSATLSASTGTSVVATPTVNTTYSVIATDANGCKDTAQTIVNIKSGGTVTSAGATICSGASTVLTASGASTYTWSPSTGLSNTVGSSVVASPTTTTTYTINATFSNGCTGSTTATVTVNTVSVSLTSSRSVCAGSGVALTATGSGGASPYTYAWSPTSTLSAASGSPVTATPTATIVYTVVATDANGCTGRDTQQIIVKTSPVTSRTGENFYYCGNNDITLSCTTATASLFAWWSSNTGVSGSYTSGRNGTTGGANGYVGTPADSTTTTSITTTMLIKTPPNNDQFFYLNIENNGCSFPIYFYLREFKSSSTVVPSIGSNQTYCGSSTATSLSLQGTTQGSYSPQWSVSTTSSSTGFSNVGTASTTYSPGSVGTTSWYRLILTPGGGCGGPYTSNVVQITIGTAISSNTLSASNCVTTSTLITGSTPAGGSGTYTYQWQSSTDNSTWSDVIGATSINYTAPLTSTIRYYRRIVTSDACESTSSAISISPAIMGNEISSAQNVCSGTAANTLSVGTLSGGTGSYTYRWQSASASTGPWTNIAGAAGASSTYSPGVLGSTTWYRLLDTSGACTATSNAIQVKINPLPTVSITPSTTSVCSGNTATLTATANQNSTYSWSVTSGTGTVSPSTGSVVIATPTSNSTYTVTVTDTNNCTNTANQAITFNTLPTAMTLNSGGAASICNPPNTTYSLSSIVSGSAPSGVTYKWYTVSSNPSATYEIASGTVNSSGSYYGYAQDDATLCFSTAATATITFVSVAKPTPLSNNIVLCDPLRANLTTYEPEAASGTTFEWHTVSSSPNAGTRVNPATSVGTVGATNTYYLYAKSTAVGCYSPASDAVSVTINASPSPTVSSGTASVCSPGTVDLMALINSPSATSTYQWFTSNTNPAPANMIENPYAVAVSGTYYLYETNSNTCRTETPTSVVVTVNSSPTLSVANTTSICEGTADTLFATASGSPTYQWYMVNTSTNAVTTLSNTSPYDGVTTSQLKISNTTGLGSNLYYVTATASGCSTTSDYAALQLKENTVTTTIRPRDTVISSLPAGATFKYTANTSNVDYYWQVYNGVIWRTIGTSGDDPTLYANYTTNTLEVLTVADSMNNFKFRCQSGNSCDTAFGIATLNTPTSLPVSGVMLQAHREQNNLKLRWVAFSEQDVASYDVQYASDAVNFRNIDKVVVASPSFTTKEYNVLTRPIPGYYRIQANGNIPDDRAFSNTVYFNDRELIKTGLHPNPAVSGEVAVNMTGLVSEMPAEVSIFSVEGRLLQKTTMVLKNGNNNLKLNAAVQERPLVLVRIHQPEIGEMLHTKLMIAR